MRISLAAKIYLTFLALFSAILLGFAVNYLATDYNANLLNQIQTKQFPLFELANEISFKTKNLQELNQVALITNEEDDLDATEDLTAEIQGQIKAIELMDSSLEGNKSLSRKFETYQESYKSLAKSMAENSRELGELGEQIEAMQSSYAAFVDGVEGYKSQLSVSLNKAIEEGGIRSEQNIYLGFLTLTFGVIITFLTIFFARSHVSRPIQALAKASKAISSGVYPQPVKVRTKDELGILSKQFNEMVRSIEANQAQMEYIISSNRSLSGARNLEDFGISLKVILDEIMLDNEYIFFIYSSYFIAKEDTRNNIVYTLSEDGSFKANKAPEDLKRRINISDPKTSNSLACLLLNDHKKNFDDIKLVVDALGSSIANTLNAIKLGEAMNIINEKNQQINAIFEAVPQGICLVNEDLRIIGESSKHLLRIFEDIEETLHYPIVKRLFPEGEALSNIQSVFQSCIGEESIFFDMNRHLLPHTAKLDSPREKEFELDWQIIESNSIIESIMLSIRDVTDIRELQRQAEKKSDEIAAISQIIDIEPQRFINYLEMVEDLQREYSYRSDDNKVVIKRFLHTLKGNSRIMGLNELSEHIHQIEEYFDKDQEKNLVTEFFSKVDSYQSLFQKFRGKASKENKHSIRSCREAFAYLQTINRNDLQNRNNLIIEDILLERIGKNLIKILHEVGVSAQKVALSEGYPEPQINIDSPSNITVINPIITNIVNSLNHLTNNSIAHGIPHVEGSINMKVGILGELLKLEYWDSGKGLNLGKIADKFENPDELSDEEIAMSIFQESLSTSESQTLLAGRGVGLGAARSLVEDLGGQLELQFTSLGSRDRFRTFKFIITIPSEYIVESSVMNTIKASS